MTAIILQFPGIYRAPPAITTPEYDSITERAFKISKRSLYTMFHSETGFNFEIYRALDRRFAGRSHGCSYKKPFTLDDGEVSVDTYGKLRGAPHVLPTDMSRIWHVFYTAFETDNKGNATAVALRDSKRIIIGNREEPMPWIDAKYGTGKELIKLCNYYGVRYEVRTRSDLIAREDYRSLLGDGASVDMRLSTLDDDINRTLEPAMPSVKRRLSAIKKLQDDGIGVMATINSLASKLSVDNDKKIVDAVADIGLIPIYATSKPLSPRAVSVLLEHGYRQWQDIVNYDSEMLQHCASRAVSYNDKKGWL